MQDREAVYKRDQDRFREGVRKEVDQRLHMREDVGQQWCTGENT